MARGETFLTAEVVAAIGSDLDLREGAIGGERHES
jgi:hypothetical protein